MNKYINIILRKISRHLFDSYVYSKLMGRHHVVVCGDSHANVFNYMQANLLLKKVLFDVTVVGGATAQGMVNPNSKTNSLNIFLDRIRKMKNWQEMFFLLGEVDCGFVIWFYSEKFNISIEEQMNRSISNYKKMLLKIKKIRKSQITILSSPLPTIKDKQTWGEVANSRKEIKATLMERTILTLKYNEGLKKMCDELSITYLDISTELFSDSTKVIDERFLNQNPLNHHLNNKAYSSVITNALRLTKKYV